MEIWLLLTVVGMVSSVEAIEAVNKITKREGSTVDLQCNLLVDVLHPCTVSWHFNSNEPSENGLKNHSKQRLNKCSSAALTWTLSNITQNDTGWYFCTVSKDIPFLDKKKSNWTHLVVESPPVVNVWSDWWVWIAAGASGFVLVILLILCLVLIWRQCKKKDLENQVYVNMRVNGSRQASPRARPTDNSTLKTESSYQNLRTPDVNKRYENSRRLAPNR